MSEPMSVGELTDFLWTEYNTLGVTPVEAMCNMWDDIRDGHLFPWISDEHGVDARTLALAVADATLRTVEGGLNVGR
jgi:hypothetical protein